MSLHLPDMSFPQAKRVGNLSEYRICGQNNEERFRTDPRQSEDKSRNDTLLLEMSFSTFLRKTQKKLSLREMERLEVKPKQTRKFLSAIGGFA